MATKKPKTANEIKFLNGKDSKEEVYMMWYLQELKDAGILVDFVYHPETFHLLDGMHYNSVEERPRSNKTHRYTFTQSHEYTPDWLMIWSYDSYRFKFVKPITTVSQHNFIVAYSELKNKFFCQNSRTLIDVKPGFNKNPNDSALFEYKRSLMLLKHGLNVQKVIIEDLFKHTFTPIRYLKTDMSGKTRKISDWKPITLSQFLTK